jgi:hypothetical protein
MGGIHCFECSELFDAAGDMALTFTKARLAGKDKLAFLPAPKTWIEWRNPIAPCHQHPNGTVGRMGALLIEEGEYADVWLAHAIPGGTGPDVFASFPGYFRMPLSGNPDMETFNVSAELQEFIDGHMVANLHGPFLYALLAMINTPRVIGRRQHMPHAGLQRKLARAKGMVGKYPLHAWHEVKLEVTPPRLDRSATGEPHETRLTGAKARHFCRAHLRVRLGALELVSPHWRGDPALGIKQTRYRVVKPERELEPV